jgi:hypothetical protein
MRLKLLIAATGITIELARAAVAFEYEVEGKLENEGYLALGKVVKDATTYFTVSVKDCRWLIQFSADLSKVAGGYKQVAFDGQNLYYFGVRRDSGKNAIWGGAVSRDTVPYSAAIPRAPIIWLAFASSCYLDAHPKKLLPPYSSAMVRAEISAQVVRCSGGARLPRSIVFMDDGFDRTYGKPKVRPAPYDKGFTNAIFTALGFTKVAATEVPREFSLVVFRPSSEARSAGELEVAHVFRGIVTEIREGCTRTDFVPEIPLGIEGRISDTRLASRDAIVPQPFAYRASNWLSMEQVRQLPGFEAYSKAQPLVKDFVPILVTTNKMERAVKESASAVRFGFVAVIVGTSTLLAVFLLWFSKIKRVETNKQQKE